ncbi:polysaccharide lyase 6 family protein [Vibrio sp. B1Z05]|uniref:polysaccharide lyase 6 family protein n=1 Tax=Vibrio sp. B1Z05 TaxID=2654980 RepID=UPI00128D4579|nr:polysaccharide lyase 6 family protein [Vibrio sp. B1Z05]MPW35283.1 alginate lyase precursor [Vibrio sp. B1Z05]
MKRKTLAILIGLALVGCNSESNTAAPSQQAVKAPTSTAAVQTNSTKLTPDTEVVDAAKIEPSTEIPQMAEISPATDIVQTPTLPISKFEANDAAFRSTGIPEGVTKIPEVKCDKVFDSLEDLEKVAKDSERHPETLAAGSTLCLADGEYSDDLDLRVVRGMTVAAEHSGKAIIKDGVISISLNGEHSRLQGLVFKDITYKSAMINTRGHDNTTCTDCRITEISVIDPKTVIDKRTGQGKAGNLVKLYGDGNWFDHSILSGKTSANPMISLVREKGLTDEQRAHNIVVYKNYIANRAPADGKIYAGAQDNNYEAIRTGLSETHEQASHSFVVGNLFENIQGEAEVISNKASENTISFNTIRNSNGSLTNRHGHDNNIENNFILGEGYPLAGGIRIVDNGHVIQNNYIDGARYLSTTHHGGIVLLGSDGAGDGDNGYQQVENVHIAHNTIVDSVNSLNLDGGGKKTQPQNVFIENNIVEKAIGPIFKSSDRGLPPNSEILGNIFSGNQFADSDGIKESQLASQNSFESAELERNTQGDHLYRPTANTPNLDATLHVTRNFTAPTYDMDGQLRSAMTTIGADERNATTRTVAPLSYKDVGPVTYKVTKPSPIVVTADIKNSNFDNWLEDWQGQGGYTVTGAEAFSGQTLALSDNGYMRQDIAVMPNHHYELSAFVKGNYKLSVDGIASTKGDVKGDQYKWVRVPFDTGSNDTVTVSLGIPETVTVNAPLVDGDFTQYYKGDRENWVEHEDSVAGLGEVGGSKDSAFSGEGSIRLRFINGTDEDGNNIDAKNDFTAQPSVTRVVSGLPTNTDVTFSMYYCDKMGDKSLATLGFGARTVAAESLKGTLLKEDFAHNKDLANAPEGSNKDCFKKVTTTFNTGDNTSIELFANMIVDKDGSLTNDQIKTDSFYQKNKFEVRLDNFAVSYEAKASDDLTASFDEIRAATRMDQKPQQAE